MEKTAAEKARIRKVGQRIVLEHLAGTWPLVERAELAPCSEPPNPGSAAIHARLLDEWEHIWNSKAVFALEDKASQLIFLGISLALFGFLDKLDQALELAVEYPSQAFEAFSRRMMPALYCVLPLPQGHNNPESTLSWLKQNQPALNWNAEVGHFVISRPTHQGR